MNAARRFPLRWTAAWLWTLCAVAASAQTQTPQQIAKKALASTVLVVAGNAEGEIAGVGSGFFVQSGLIATNQHVINGETVIGVRLVNQERFHRIDSVATQDEELDLALLRVSSLSAPALPLGDSDALQIGEPIYAVGNPVGFLEGTFSDGLVSGIRALPNLKLIQMTAPISEGSSGGPVLNGKGEVVGVSTAGIKLGQNLNFAVPSNALKKMLERIGRPNLIAPTPRPKPAVSPDRFADYMKWSLPKGAKARLGRGKVETIAYSPDGRTLAVASSVGIWLYNVQTGTETALHTGTSNVYSMAYSPDGRTIAGAREGNIIRIWNAHTGALIKTLTEEHVPGVWSIVYSPDGRFIASGHNSSENEGYGVCIWDARTGALIKTLTDDYTRGVTYSPDGRFIAASSVDFAASKRDRNMLSIWDARTGALIKTLDRPEQIFNSTIHSMVYSPDGRTIAGRWGNIWFIWNANTGALIETIPGGYYKDSASYSPDGRTIAFADSNRIIILDAHTGEFLKMLDKLPSTEFMAYSPDGRTIAGVSRGSDVYIFDARTGALLKTIAKSIGGDESVAYSPDGRSIASVNRGDVYIFDARTGALLKTIENIGFSRRVAYSPDGRFIAAGSITNGLPVPFWTIQIWDARTGSLLRTLDKFSIYNLGTPPFMAYSPDGLTLASGIDDEIGVWNVHTGALLRTLKKEVGIRNTLAYSPDSRTLASGDSANVKVWDVHTGALLRTLKTDGFAEDVAYSPDGRTLAGIDNDSVKIWDARTGALLRTLKNGGYETGWVAYSPDGRTLASGSSGNIYLWDAKTGALLRTLEGHASDVKSVAYSPDSKTLASASDDGTILLWNISDQ